ncbi:hypothetical protein OHS18_13385 [Amycolatopsis sp. NBC_00355]|uniref:hypothetical protein n=1 Tax=Amycolatopsis sp. NBC_00355 TaxID=2975957 RepID=UPI002E259C10
MGKVLVDAIGVPCVAALVIPLIVMVFDRWKPAYGTAAAWVSAGADVAWGVALFVTGLRQLRKERHPDVHHVHTPVSDETTSDRSTVADNW